MKVFTSQVELSNYLKDFSSKSIGLVPTMGALHFGHLSLISRSNSDNDITVVSIFVNPTQFNNREDLEKYPRTLDSDIEKIQSISSDVIVFAPEVDEIYKNGAISQKFDLGYVASVMEGASRPGHFDGVCTIVKKLFEIVKPQNAYFGEKDFQQILVIEKMIDITHLPVNIVRCPIVRHESGLALSSRNQRLSDKARENASFIFQSLNQAKTAFENSGIFASKQLISDLYSNNPLFSLEYFTITEQETLREANVIEQGKHYRAFIVVNVEGVRLIDNLQFM